MQPVNDNATVYQNAQASTPTAAVEGVADQQVVDVCNKLKAPMRVDAASVENVGPRNAASCLKLALSTEAQNWERVES